MTRRPIVEHRPPDPAESRKRRAAETYADVVLARACEHHPGLHRDVVAGIFINRATRLAQYAVDAPRAQSLLGAASGRVGTFKPVSGDPGLAEAVFRRRA